MAAEPTYSMETKYPCKPSQNNYECKETFKGFECDTMSLRIMENFNKIKDNGFQHLHKSQIVFELNAIIQQYYCYHPLFGPPYLFIIGSTVTGLSVDGGDLDLCVVVSPIQLISHSEALHVLHGIQKIFLQIPRWQNCEVIDAVVPILAIHDKKSGIIIDLNVNNLTCIRNTSLLHCYAHYDWRVAPLILFIKRWAKEQNINSAKENTLSSYALTLMIINYLQCGVGNQPVLPSLQVDYPGLFHGNLPMFASEFRSFLQKNDMSLGDLLLGFFRLYGTSFRFDKDVVCVSVGRVIPKANMPVPFGGAYNQTSAASYKNTHLFVEEPFNGTNVARSVYKADIFEKVKKAFRTAYETLKQTRDPYSILAKVSDTPAKSVV